MKKNVLLVLSFLFLLIIGCQQEVPKKNIIKFQPEHPIQNKSLTISFTPGIKSPLAQADSITLQALFVPVNPTDREILEDGKMNEIPMQKNGITWEANIVPTQTTGCIVFQFEAQGKYENNNQKGWEILLYSQDGKPVEGAYSALSQATGEGMVSFLLNLRRLDADSAFALYEKEMSLHPDNWRAMAVSLNIRYRKAVKENNETEMAKTESELTEYIAAHPDDLKLWEFAYSFFYRPDPKKAEQVVEHIGKINPKHRYVLNKKLIEIRKIKNIKKRLNALLAMEKEVQNTSFYWSWARYILPDLSAQKKWDAIIEISKKMIATIKSDTFFYPSYTKKKTEQKRKSYFYTPLSAMATAYYKTGKNQKAQECFDRLSQIELYPHQEVAFAEAYLQFLVDTKQWDKATEIAINAIEKAKSNDKIIELFKTAYTKKGGDSKAAEQVILKAKKKSGAYREEEIAKTFITNAKAAPEFSLKDLDGKTVSLASLRGKTVIVDFWATWCSPCKASFPYLQKFWEEHQNNPKIALFAVNTSEQIKGEARVKAIKKFMTKNKYTFPVLLDDNNSSVKKAFEVGGIPTKFFIGPDGKIYFKEIGFHGPGMTDDMNIQIKLIKEKIRIKK